MIASARDRDQYCSPQHYRDFYSIYKRIHIRVWMHYQRLRSDYRSVKPLPPYTLQRKASGSFRHSIVRNHISTLLKRDLDAAAVSQPRF
jgi:hypothetical protein